MSIGLVAAIAVGVLFVGGLMLFGLVALVLWATGGKRPKAMGGLVLSPFQAEVEEALAIDNEATRAKARAYDLAKKQELLDAIRAHKAP